MKNIVIIIFAAVTAAAVILVIAVRSGSGKLSQDEARREIQKLLEREIVRNSELAGGIILVHAAGQGFREIFTAGRSGGMPVASDQPFHIASIGKTFTAVLTGMAADERRLTLDDPVADYLPAEILQGLFVIDGTDYKAEVTIAQLLGHTSGIADYFEDPAVSGPDLRELILLQPDRFWTPEDLLAFTRDKQKTAARPGEGYHYSDTGYILLGLLLEEVFGLRFHELLHSRIFQPLGMDDSCFHLYSEPVNGPGRILDIYIDGTNVTDYTSLTIDWAGGGIISTVDDLAVFVRALYDGSLVSHQVLERMGRIEHRFTRGIGYGLGLMEYRFGDFFPTLKSYPDMQGHMGVLGTQMLYNPEADMLYISAFGSSGYSAGSVKTAIRVLGTIRRIVPDGM